MNDKNRRPADGVKKRTKKPHMPKWKLGITECTRVLVRHDNGQDVWHTVIHKPWLPPSGTWLIGLSGISGGYSLDRVLKMATGTPSE